MAVLHLQIWVSILATGTERLIRRLLLLLISMVVDTFTNGALCSRSLDSILSTCLWTSCNVGWQEVLSLSCLELILMVQDVLLMRVITVDWELTILDSNVVLHLHQLLSTNTSMIGECERICDILLPCK